MSKSKKNQCYSDLRDRILQIELAPGTDLDEASFSSHYGLSRTPLREVFQKLAGEGFITVEPNRGAVVSAMDLVAMRQFFQTAPIIYSAIARLAAEQHTKLQLRTLKDAQYKFLQACADSDASGLALWNHRFHETIGEMAANPYLQPSQNRLLIDHTRLSHKFYQARSAKDGIRIKKAASQHDNMIGAFSSQNAALVVELTLDHWALSRHEIEKYVWPDPLPNDVAALSAGGKNEV